MAIAQGNYAPGVLDQGQRQELWNSYGRSGDAPVGWNGEGGGAQLGAPSSSNSGYQAPDYTKLAQQMLDMQKQANAPVVSSLQSQIPTIQQSYATKGSALQSQIDPLKQRYESALSALSAGSASDLNTAQIGASREFGARGVPLSSSAYDQYLQKQTLPITSSYAGNYGQLQGQEAQDVLGLQNQIAGIPVQQQQDIGQLNQSIAQLQAGGNSTAITNALQMYQMQQQAQQQAAQNAIAQQQAASLANLQQAQAGYFGARGTEQQALAGKTNVQANNLSGGGVTGVGANLVFNPWTGQMVPANASSPSGPAYFTPVQ